MPDRTTGPHLSTLLRLVVLAAFAVLAYVLLSAGAARADDKPAPPVLKPVTDAVAPAVERVQSTGNARAEVSRTADQAAGNTAHQAVGNTAPSGKVAGDVAGNSKAVGDRVSRAGRNGTAAVSHTTGKVQARAGDAGSQDVRIIQRSAVTTAGQAVRRQVAKAGTSATIDAVRKPVARTSATPARTLQSLTQPVSRALRPVTKPAAATLHTVTAPLPPITTAPLTTAVRPGSGPLTSTVRPVAGLLNTAVRSVTKPLTTAVRPVTGPVATAVRPITVPLTATPGPVVRSLAPVAHVVRPPLTAPGLTAPGLTAPALIRPRRTAPSLTAPSLTAPSLTAPGQSSVVRGTRSHPAVTASSATAFRWSPAQVPAAPAARSLFVPASTGTVRMAAGAPATDDSARPRCMQDATRSSHRGATPGTPGPAPRPAPGPDPASLDLMTSSASAGTDSGPGMQAITSAAWLPAPALAGTAVIDSVHCRGHRPGCVALPG